MEIVDTKIILPRDPSLGSPLAKFSLKLFGEKQQTINLTTRSKSLPKLILEQMLKED